MNKILKLTPIINGEKLNTLEYKIQTEEETKWVKLFCDNGLIAILVNEEEARRVVWSHWNQKGMHIEPLKINDFIEVKPL